MKWRFTLIDKEGVETEIDEPVGWDAVSIEVSRDKAAHGIFFDYQGNDFLFYKEAFHLLKAAYEADGIEAYSVLKIEQECGDTELQELYRGRLLFAKAIFNCGDECFVKLPIETVSEVMTLRNRWDQPVDLQTLKGFDEETELQPYRRLGTDVMLPAKTIVMKNKATVNTPSENVTFISDAGKDGSDRTQLAWFNIVPAFDDVKLSEFGSFQVPQETEVNYVCNGSYAPISENVITVFDGDCSDFFLTRDPGDKNKGQLFFDWAQNTALLNFLNTDDSDVITEIAITGAFKLSFKTALTHLLYTQAVLCVLKKSGEINVITSAMDVEADKIFNGNPNTYVGFNATHELNFVFNETLSVEKDDRLFLTVNGMLRYSDAEPVGNKALTVTTLSSSVEISTNSKADPTPSKLFLINESISRVAEAITDDNIRAYSDYFGRVDSEPYATDKDGCGSMAGITNGIFVRRQEKRVADQPAPMPVSMKDLFDGLNPIHNIGFGIEADPFREGYSVLRVEPWKYFYQPEILMCCDAVDKIEKSVQDAEHYSTFQIGYAKWEAEQYNGLDEFLTKRKYRTTLSTVKNELTQLSKFIASGYALEITRRQQTDSKDWRFDNDTFIICLKRGGAEAGTLLDAESPNILNIAVFGDAGFDFWNAFFDVGDTIHVSSFANTGNFTIAAIENIPGNVKVTVAEPVVDALGFATITNLTGGMSVELGNILNPQNIIDPPTIYNYRISPARNALRWMSTILASYRHPESGKIIFTDGEGNFAASGKMQSPVCRLEKDEIIENQALDIHSFADELQAAPVLRPERVVFDYPMSVKDFRSLLEKPYGLIAYRNDCEQGAGWIENIKYQPNEGSATFTLIPEIT